MSLLKEYINKVYLETSIHSPDIVEQFIRDAKADGWEQLDPTMPWQKQAGYIVLRKIDGKYKYVALISNIYKANGNKDVRSIAITRDDDEELVWPSKKYPNDKYDWKAIIDAPFTSRSKSLRDLYTIKRDAKTPHWTGD